MDELPDDAVTIPIGRPIAHSTAYVLDGRGRLVPPGTPGGLYLGGDGLALGYHERPELTAERFVPHPFREGERLYRTGDVVVQRGDGALVFVGRDDHQVKLRGFRIELGEVEAALRGRPGVRDVCVLLREDRPGDKQLVAYVVPDRVLADDASGDGATDDDLVRRLREELSADVPAYMLPSAMVIMDALPLTVNGKVDRAALPAPEGRPASRELVPPAPGLQSEVAALWCAVLGLERVGATDDFFELGGHSLLATQLLNRLGKRFAPVKLPLRALFDHPTVAGLAEQLERAGALAPTDADDADDAGRSTEGPAAEAAPGAGALPDADAVGDLSDEEVEALLRRLSGETEPRP